MLAYLYCIDCILKIILGWDIILSGLRNRDISRTLENAENEIQINIPITLVDNPDYFAGDDQGISITVCVDQNRTAEVTHNITLTQSEEIMEDTEVPEILNVRLYL